MTCWNMSLLESSLKFYWAGKDTLNVNRLSANLTKMVKHTQTILRLLPKSFLIVFDHFVGLALKELKIEIKAYLKPSWISTAELFFAKIVNGLVVNYFRNQALSWTFDWVLNKPVKTLSECAKFVESKQRHIHSDIFIIYSDYLYYCDIFVWSNA